MSRDPQDDIRVCMKFGDQIRIGYSSVPAPSHQRTETSIRQFDAYRYVRSDDHEFTFSLALIEFFTSQS